MLERIMRNLAAELRALVRCRKGSGLPILAVVMPTLVGMLGLAVDAGVWYGDKRTVQNSADAAAVSAAYRLAANDRADMVSAATADATRNGFDSASPATVTLNNPPQSGAYAGNPAAVSVTLAEPRPLYFSALFLNGDVTVAARAVALVKITGGACVLALDPAAAGAVTVQGSTTANMSHCVVAANSTDAGAIDIAGNGDLAAQSLWTAGNIAQGNSATLTLAEPPSTGTWQLADPFAGASIPSLGACTAHNLNINNATRTLTPGVYCGGIDIGGSSVVTLEPGTYYVDGGDVSIGAQATVTCDCGAAGSGVTIVLTSSSSANQIGQVTINGGASVTLNAPSDASAPYRGLVFFQDPRGTSSQDNKFNGGSTMNLTGGIYFPSESVEWTGNNSTGTPTCTEIVSNTVTFIGNSNLDNSGCAAAGVNPIQIQGVAQVE